MGKPLKFRDLGDGWREYTDEKKGLFIQAKVYDVGSDFGISGGRISKLFVRRLNNVVISYDRGWDVNPNTAADRNLLTAILLTFK